jgi:hypothetical protein
MCSSESRFCQDAGIRPNQLSRLKKLAGTAAEMQTMEHNCGGRYADLSAHAIATLEIYAMSMDFNVQWPGLYPLLTKNGRSVTLSEDGLS